MKMRNILLAVMGIAIVTGAAGCSEIKPTKREAYPMTNEDARRAKRGKIFGEGGISLFSSEKNNNNSGVASGIGVNAFLWRATLETLSFLPLDSVDPHGGVILTDWYSDPAVKDERIKLNVLILDTALRVDALKITVFKQKRTKTGWKDVAVGKETSTSLEDKILIRAREMRIKKANG